MVFRVTVLERGMFFRVIKSYAGLAMIALGFGQEHRGASRPKPDDYDLWCWGGYVHCTAVGCLNIVYRQSWNVRAD